MNRGPRPWTCTPCLCCHQRCERGAGAAALTLAELSSWSDRSKHRCTWPSFRSCLCPLSSSHLLLCPQAGFTGDVPVTATAQSPGDSLYDGLSVSGLTVYVEDLTPPAINVISTAAQLEEGSQMTYQIALSTAPSAEVTVSLDLLWLEGIERLVGFPPTVTFPAGDAATEYQTITVNLPYSPAFTGESSLAIVHTATSEDPRYNTAAGTGAAAVEVPLLLQDLNAVGVCLGDCLETTQFDLLFTGADPEPRETAFQIVSTQVSGRAGGRQRPAEPRLAIHGALNSSRDACADQCLDSSGGPRFLAAHRASWAGRCGIHCQLGDRHCHVVGSRRPVVTQ